MGQAKKKFWIPPNPQILAPHPYLRHMQVLNERRPIHLVFVFKSTRRNHISEQGGERTFWKDRNRGGARVRQDGGRQHKDFGFSWCCTNKLWCSLLKNTKVYIEVLRKRKVYFDNFKTLCNYYFVQ